MADFVGFTELNGAFSAPVLIRDTGLSPIDADAFPVYRVYGPSGILLTVTGSCSFLDSGAITVATNSNPVVYTSANHGLTSGFVVTAAGVTGNTGANTFGIVTVINANQFSIANSVGTGSGTGGTWHMTGLYTYSFTAAPSSGFASSTLYVTLVEGTAGGISFSYTQTFSIN